MGTRTAGRWKYEAVDESFTLGRDSRIADAAWARYVWEGLFDREYSVVFAARGTWREVPSVYCSPFLLVADSRITLNPMANDGRRAFVRRSVRDM